MMKLVLVTLFALLAWAGFIFMVDALVFAQAPMAAPTLAPEVQNLVTQLRSVGCQAEETAATQTIAQLRKENEELKLKLDPPKSGATKH